MKFVILNNNIITIENTNDPALTVNFSYTFHLRAEYNLRWEQEVEKSNDT